MVSNYTEVAIDNILPEILGKYNSICKCQKCIDDIKALALNNLKPIYTVTEKGSVYARLNELNAQFVTDAISELVRAIEIVSKSPHHDSK